MANNQIRPSHDLKNLTFKSPASGIAIDIPAKAIALFETNFDGTQANILLKSGYSHTTKAGRIMYSYDPTNRHMNQVALVVEDINQRGYTPDNGLAERIAMLLEDQKISSRFFNLAASEISHASMVENPALQNWRADRRKFYVSLG